MQYSLDDPQRRPLVEKTLYSPALAFFLFALPLAAGPAPFDGTTFHGRIADSADGNHNDEDN